MEEERATSRYFRPAKSIIVNTRMKITMTMAKPSIRAHIDFVGV